MRRGWVPALCAALLLPAPAGGSGGAASALTATRLRAGSHPAFVRVVVDFSAGAVSFNTTEATDPQPFDGTARVEVSRAGVRSSAAPLAALGVNARAAAAGGRLTVRLTASRGRFKYLSYELLHAPERIAIDLWRSVPTVSARLGRAGCLTLSSYSTAPPTATVSGRERDLFEHSLVVRLRGLHGGLVASKPVVAAAGRWSARLRARVPRQRGTLEAASFSAKDGALDCLVQTPVRLGA